MKLYLPFILTFLAGLVVALFLPPVAPIGVAAPTSGTEADATSAPTKRASGQTGAIPAAGLALPDPFIGWQRHLANIKANTKESRAELVKRMAETDPERAWRTLQKAGAGMTIQDIQVIAGAWSAKNAEAAATFGLTLEDRLQRPVFLASALSHWLSLDIRALHVWLGKQPAELDLARYLKHSNLSMEMKNPGLSELALLVQIDPPGARFPQEFGELVARLWLQQEQREIITTWVNKLEDPVLRDAAWVEICKTKTESDPRSAAVLMAEIRDPRRSREISSSIAAQIALTQPREALTFALTLQNALARQGAWESAFSTWLHREPTLALSSIPSDTPLSWLAFSSNNMGTLAPLEAIQAIQSLTDTDRRAREYILQAIVMGWQRQSPAAAARWLSTESSYILPAPLRQELLSGVAVASKAAQGVTTKVINGRSVTFAY